MKFILEIELGNDAMQTGEDIAGALDNVAKTLRRDWSANSYDGKIRDVNGNLVGNWKVVEIDVCLAGNPAVNGVCGDALCVCAPVGQIVYHGANHVAAHTNEQLAHEDRRDHNYCSTCSGWFKPVPRRSRAERIQGTAAHLPVTDADAREERNIDAQMAQRNDKRLSITLEIKTKHGQTVQISEPENPLPNNYLAPLFEAWRAFADLRKDANSEQYAHILRLCTSALNGRINRRDYATDVREV